MLTKQKIVVEVEEKTWQCDFCDYKLTTRDVGFSRGMTNCSICKKDICRGKHAKWYSEDGGDYADALVCPDCDPKFSEAWEWAKQNAGRYDDLMDIVKRRLAQETTAALKCPKCLVDRSKAPCPEITQMDCPMAGEGK